MAGIVTLLVLSNKRRHAFPAGFPQIVRQGSTFMQLVQFYETEFGRRAGLVDGSDVIDLTSAASMATSVYDIARHALGTATSMVGLVSSLVAAKKARRIEYSRLLQGVPGQSAMFLLPPFDHPLPHAMLVSGTGLTHLGSVKSRDQMHGGDLAEDPSESRPQTDSARMFAMGLAGGRPEAGRRGVSPEWFYKGNGSILRAHNDFLDVPPFALDGGEEPEVAGCYIIAPDGSPRRLGFVIGNEWSDHATEKINYLYLAPSKLRSCSIGPSLQITDDFQEVLLRCTVERSGKLIYDSGELWSGERHMCHSLSNLEDHHFKYPQHRHPGDAHIHFFGTSRLSFSTRDWTYSTGDIIRIQSPGFSSDLINTVRVMQGDASVPVGIQAI
jgi:hypothetical protein